ncbi:vomeronasal type-1 receptor 100-like, partial [Rhynchocyon petersi]
LCWICNSLISSNLLYYVTAVNNMNRSGPGQYVQYCYMLPSTQAVRWLFFTLMVLRDMIFQGVMGWSSGYLAFCLYKHHRCVLYLQRTGFTKSKRTSPEIRAIQSVLELMSCFLFFHWADFIFSLYTGSFFTIDPLMHHVKIFLELSYATLSPFMLFSRGNVCLVPIFNFQSFLGDINCKITIFLVRVARGLSICTTCLLSVVQAITISPRTNTWTKLKLWIKQQIFSSLLFFWICNSLISSNLLYYVTAVNNVNRSGTGQCVSYCYMLPSTNTVRWIFLTLMSLRDISFQSLMAWSSGYMVFLLHKHHKRVFYLQSARFTKSNKTSPDIRATQSVLMLMACFLFFYWADFTLSFFIGSFFTNDPIMYNVKIFLELCYATLSPFMLMGKDIYQSKCWAK